MAKAKPKYEAYIDGECVFCKIVKGDVPNYTVWEDEEHLAFLTPFPNTEGTTVVIPKMHVDSYFTKAPLVVVQSLIETARKVATKIDSAYDDVGRTALVFEGFGVNHLHAKLFPMHKTASDDWHQRCSSVETYFEHYEGYISSHDGPQISAQELEKIAAKIRG